MMIRLAELFPLLSAAALSTYAPRRIGSSRSDGEEFRVCVQQRVIDICGRFRSPSIS